MMVKEVAEMDIVKIKTVVIGSFQQACSYSEVI